MRGGLCGGACSKGKETRCDGQGTKIQSEEYMCTSATINMNQHVYVVRLVCKYTCT